MAEKIKGGTVVRTHHYVVVKGVEMTQSGDMLEQEHVIDGKHEDVEYLKRKARREWPDFLPREFSWHRQRAEMSEKDFYGMAKFGDDEEYTPKRVSETPSEVEE